MSEDKKSVSADDVEMDVVEAKKAKDSRKADKKPNFFVRIWKKLCKLCKDVVGEMKKVVWTPKDELKKSSRIVLATVVAVGVAIAIVDTSFSWIINSIAGLIG